ncbi:MAG: hypothetical protein AAF437_02640 [Pseudomonadota bacterium]
MRDLNILILGATYGLLPAMRILTAGHRVSVVCRAEEQAALIQHGARILFKSSDQRLEATAAKAPAPVGTLGVTDADIDLAAIDLVILAMSEPHFRAPEIASLVGRIGAAQLPVISISNTPPPPFLQRLGDFDIDLLQDAYLAWDTWKSLHPDQVTSASPDAQAVRRNPDRTNELTVTLGSNFKIAPFARAEDQALLEQLASDISSFKIDGDPVNVRLIPHGSLFAPLAKWPMLITGNCRCLQPNGEIISISDAVRTNLEESQAVYEWVLDVVRATGAKDSDLVPFRHYAAVSRRLIAPSSFARAVHARASGVERIDKMVQLTARAFGLSLPVLDTIVEQADRHIAQTTSTT